MKTMLDMTINATLLNWANGRLKTDIEAIEHIEKFGLIPNDGRPRMLQFDLAAIVNILGDFAATNNEVQRIRAFFKKHHIDEIPYDALYK